MPLRIDCKAHDSKAFVPKELTAIYTETDLPFTEDDHGELSFGIINDIHYKDKPLADSIVDHPSFDNITIFKISDDTVGHLYLFVMSVSSARRTERRNRSVNLFNQRGDLEFAFVRLS